MFRYITVLFVLILAATECWAVQPYEPVQSDPMLDPWRWRLFPELQGQDVSCIAEDKDGNMWFGVRDGVVRYDGFIWTTFTPDGGSVRDLLTARDGSLYASTDTGISRYAKGKWHRVFPPQGSVPIDDMIEASDGSIWAVLGEWGAIHLKSEGATLYTANIPNISELIREVAPHIDVVYVPDDVTRTGTDPYGLLWLAPGRVPGSGPVFHVFPGGEAEAAGLQVGDRITAVNGHPRKRPVDSEAVTLTVRRKGRLFDVTVAVGDGMTYPRFPVVKIHEGKDGALWFVLWRPGWGGVVRYEPNGASDTAWRLYTEKDGLQAHHDPHIAQTSDGTVWVVSAQSVSRLDPDSSSERKAWTTMNLRDQARSIYEGDDGTLWIGGWSSLYAYRHGSWTVYSPLAVPTNLGRVRNLLQSSEGALWLDGDGATARLDYRTPRWTTYKGLKYEAETPDGSHWFVSADSGVVRASEEGWVRYGAEDGLMDFPVRLLATRAGKLWAFGSHGRDERDGRAAATSLFAGSKWSTQTHPPLLQMYSAVFEATDGAVWAAGREDRNKLRSVLKFDGGRWTQYSEVIGVAYAGGEDANGTIWFGGVGGITKSGKTYSSVSAFDGKTWRVVKEPEELGIVGAMHTGRNGDLWIGVRHRGLLRFDGRTWVHYDTWDGLAGNSVKSILETDDGSVLALTGNGISRFDGRAWTTHALPADIYGRAGQLRQSRDGAIWINPRDPEYRTVRYAPDGDPPQTEITVSLEEVSQPGNTTLGWKGVDPWAITPESDLQFASRLDGGEWSSFSRRTSQFFQTLPPGQHVFEVKARDRDFNEDPTPASVTFNVVPPVWQQPWFIGLMAVLLSIIGYQASRILNRNRELKTANTALSEANKELYQANREIQEQTKRKSAFLASMSHELRTPMNAIKGFTGLVIRRIGDTIPDQQRQNLEKVTQASDHLLAMINDLLDLSKIEAGRMDVNPEPFSVQALVTYCCATVSPLVEEKPGVKLEYDVEDGIGKANTDQGRLRQMLINLLSNAIKFTDSGSVTVKAHQKNEQLVLSVSDTGKGIPEDELPTIFDEYRQVRGSDQEHKGTGLGLSITKQFAELLGGSIGVKSEVGKGSTFTVRIPMVYRES